MFSVEVLQGDLLLRQFRNSVPLFVECDLLLVTVIRRFLVRRIWLPFFCLTLVVFPRSSIHQLIFSFVEPLLFLFPLFFLVVWVSRHVIGGSCDTGAPSHFVVTALRFLLFFVIDVFVFGIFCFAIRSRNVYWTVFFNCLFIYRILRYENIFNFGCGNYDSSEISSLSSVPPSLWLAEPPLQSNTTLSAWSFLSSLKSW